MKTRGCLRRKKENLVFFDDFDLCDELFSSSEDPVFLQEQITMMMVQMLSQVKSLSSASLATTTKVWRWLYSMLPLSPSCCPPNQFESQSFVQKQNKTGFTKVHKTTNER